MPIAIATANANAIKTSCFQLLTIKTIGIKISIKRIRSLLIFCTPTWKAVLGFLLVDKLSAILPKKVESAILITTPFAEPLITLVPIKAISFKSEISWTLLLSMFSNFLTLSDSPS